MEALRLRDGAVWGRRSFVSADAEAESDGDMDRHVSSGPVEHCADHCHHDQIACTYVLPTSSLTGQVTPVVAETWLGHNVGFA